MDVNAVAKNINQYNESNMNKNMSVNKEVEKTSTTDDEFSKDANSNKDINSNKKLDEKDIGNAVKKLNKFLEAEKTHAEYGVHKELGTIMIKIVDDNSKKVVLEIPSEKILDMVASMCENAGLIDKKA